MCQSLSPVSKSLWLLALVASGALPAQTVGDPTYCSADASHQSWTIGNGLVERTLRFDPATGLTTTSLRNSQSQQEWLGKLQDAKRGVPEFSFDLDGQPLASWTPRRSEGTAAFRLLRAQTDRNERGRHLEIVLAAQHQPLEVTVTYAVYPGHPALRKWLRIRNTATRPVKLSHLCFEALKVSAIRPADLLVHTFYGTQPREILCTGRVDDMCMSMTDAKTGEGLYVLNEAPGHTKRTDFTDWGAPGGNGIKVMLDTDLFPFERSLAPGETYTSPRASLVFTRQDDPKRDPRWVLPSFAADMIMRKGKTFRPVFLYNTWEPFQRRIDEATCLELIGAAARMGIDIFTIDDGWQRYYGANTVETTRFPSGLERISQECERHGLGLGLWVPLAAIDIETEDYRAHPEWVCRDQAGRPNLTGTMAGKMGVLCLATPYRERAAQRLIELISRYRVKYLKLDLTAIFNAYGEAPGCSASGHEHASWAESLARIYEGIKTVTDRVYQAHPDVLLDLTFELWGQKHLIDYGLIAAGDLDWLSNVRDHHADDAGPRQVRQLLYHRALAIPAETMLIGNLEAPLATIAERFATAIASCPLYCGDLRRLSAADQAWYGQMAKWYQALRARVALNEGFFPLGSWQQVSAQAWDGYARLSRQGEGFAAFFANDTDRGDYVLTLKALPPGDYQLTRVFSGQNVGVFSAAALAQGLPLPREAGRKVELVELRRR